MSVTIEDKNAFLWVEKFRPSTIDEIIMPSRLRDECMSYIKDGQIPHMILAGSAGIGKTTVAKALAAAIDADLLYINASNESGVDTIRTKIVQFASTASMEGNLKAVLLDECLHEDEEVRIGTVDDWKSVPLRELTVGETYPVVSLNLENGLMENDTGGIISIKDDEVFEIELEDGRTIRANGRHPFLVMQDGKIVEKQLCELKETDEIVSIK